MAFVDELKVHIKAGDGGAGVERWRHEKAKEFGGPSGGDGGKGGSVYVVGSRDLGLLFSYRHKKAFRAENGSPGAKDSLHGKNGEDLTIKLPIGSVVTDLKTKQIVHVLSEVEGASEGKGLGHKFLRHIKRTKMIAHLISLENEDVMGAYQTIRKELEQYDKELAAKEEIIILTKTDLVDEKTLKKAQKELAVFKSRLFSLSIYDTDALKDFSDALVTLLRKKEQ